MASYYGNYQSELGRIFERIKLSVYFVDVTVVTRGTRDFTSTEEDKKYIPTMFFDKVTLIEGRGAYCTLPYRLRYALLWLNKDKYLKVELPFLPGSNEYLEFLTEAKKKVETVGVHGELIDDTQLRLYYARNP